MTTVPTHQQWRPTTPSASAPSAASSSTASRSVEVASLPTEVTSVRAAPPDALSDAPPQNIDSRPTVDQAAAQRAVTDLLRALGRDPDSPHLRETPRRVAAAFAELLTPEPFTLTTFFFCKIKKAPWKYINMSNIIKDQYKQRAEKEYSKQQKKVRVDNLMCGNVEWQ